MLELGEHPDLSLEARIAVFGRFEYAKLIGVWSEGFPNLANKVYRGFWPFIRVFGRSPDHVTTLPNHLLHLEANSGKHSELRAQVRVTSPALAKVNLR